MNFAPEFAYTLAGVAPEAVKGLEAAGLTGLAVTDAGAVTMNVTAPSMISTALTSATGLFTALIFGLVCTMIYIKLIQAKLTIKLPDSVPPAVNNAFVAMIPGVAAIFFSAIVTQVCVVVSGSYPNDLISEFIQRPLLGMSSGFFTVLLVEFLAQLFWFFGIHGMNVLAPITEGIYTPALLENLSVWNATGDISQLPYMWTRGSFDAYTMMGGSGVTLGLIIAILFFSKREDSKTIAKLAAPMGVFNINEPVIFGMPIVLNPLYFFPWVLVPVVTAAIALGFTYAGIIPPVYIQVPWIMPVGLYAFFATGGNIMAALVALLNLVVSFLIWLPFVILANKEQEKAEAAAAEPVSEA